MNPFSTHGWRCEKGFTHQLTHQQQTMHAPADAPAASGSRTGIAWPGEGCIAAYAHTHASFESGLRFCYSETESESVMHRWVVITILLGLVVATAYGDETLHRYEGDVLPDDPSAGWIANNPCDSPCTEGVANGRFFFFWAVAGDSASYRFDISRDPGEPAPPLIWVEWRFRSNHPAGPNAFICDASIQVVDASVDQLVDIYGDAVFASNGIIRDLELNGFHTYRIESLPNLQIRISVDGLIFADGLGGGGWESRLRIVRQRRLHRRSDSQPETRMGFRALRHGGDRRNDRNHRPARGIRQSR